MTYRTEGEFTSSRTVMYMRVTMSRVNAPETVYASMPTATSTQASSARATKRDRAHSHGRTVMYIQAVGKMTNSTARASL